MAWRTEFGTSICRLKQWLRQNLYPCEMTPLHYRRCWIRIRATAACCFMRESLNILDIRRWFCFVASRIQSRCKIMSVEHKELYRSRDKCTGIISLCFILSTKSARIEHLESLVSNCLLYRSFVLRWSIRTNAHNEHGTHDIVHRKWHEHDSFVEFRVSWNCQKQCPTGIFFYVCTTLSDYSIAGLR